MKYLNVGKMVGVMLNNHNYIAKRYNIITTPRVAYDVWEEDIKPEGEHYHGYGTITFIDGKCYGKVGTRIPDPKPELKVGSKERSDYIRNWYMSQYDEAYKILEIAFPETKDQVHGRYMENVELDISYVTELRNKM